MGCVYMSSENTGRNAKQQELVKRLEEIRKQRTAAETPTRSNKQNSSQAKTRKRKQKAQKPKSNQRRRNEQQAQKQTKEHSSYPQKAKQRQTAKTKRHRAKTTGSHQQSTKKNSLIKQLSDRQSITDAMILSEVLSKPIALRDRNR